ncbi:uncharacterized protein VP01_4334g2 [Puccinia sorghi]|uniref:Uncharacterized protein n=1 Tax=Puccinia sorghi TaxID=27349 RepID=A0A0L6UQS0_9BASI|nr:uncharacterized protein VP01_4334g2 [Puccinia sorghi]
MAKYHELLSSLLMIDKPLTPNNLHAAVLFSLIPQDWSDCVSVLMNQDGVKPSQLSLL